MEMSNLNDYLEQRGITEQQMSCARSEVSAYIDAYALKEARKSCKITQVELAKSMGVSQNRISRIENGDMSAMSVRALKSYIEALGGSLKIDACLPNGSIELV
jgi:DNA-binding XRE family transcriptional regulator